MMRQDSPTSPLHFLDHSMFSKQLPVYSNLFYVAFHLLALHTIDLKKNTQPYYKIINPLCICDSFTEAETEPRAVASGVLAADGGLLHSPLATSPTDSEEVAAAFLAPHLPPIALHRLTVPRPHPVAVAFLAPPPPPVALHRFAIPRPHHPVAVAFLTPPPPIALHRLPVPRPPQRPALQPAPQPLPALHPLACAPPTSVAARRVEQRRSSPYPHEMARITAVGEALHLTEEEMLAAIELARLKVEASRRKGCVIVAPEELLAHLATIQWKPGWTDLGRFHVFVLALLIKAKKGVASVYNKVPALLQRKEDTVLEFCKKQLPFAPYLVKFEAGQ